MANNFTYDGIGLALTKRFEGLSLKSYRDVAGNWTIGYGHKSIGVKGGQVITLAQATALLAADTKSAEIVVNRCVTFALTQDEFDGLVDLAFNVGVYAFASSELVRYLNAGKTTLAEAQFPVWDHAGGRVVSNLLARREAEEKLFETTAAPVVVAAGSITPIATMMSAK